MSRGDDPRDAPRAEPVRDLDEAALRDLEAELARLAPPSVPPAPPPPPSRLPGFEHPARANADPRDDATELGIPSPTPPTPRALGEVDLGRLLDDLLANEEPPAIPPAPATPPAPAVRTPAPVAGRTRSRTPPEPSDDPDALAGVAGRRRLLEALAERSNGPARARLLMAAAELEEDGDAARERWASAARADPGDPVVARGARLAALARGDVEEALGHLDVEARGPLAPADRGSAALLRAEALRARGALAEAERAARGAAGTGPPGLAAALLVWSACEARGRASEASAALEKAADAAGDDGALRARLLERVAARAEALDRPRRALGVWQEAARLEPTSLLAWLGVARAGRRVAPGDDWVAGLRAAGARVGGRTGEAFRRLAAVEERRRGRPPELVLDALGPVEAPASLRLRVELAAAARDDAAELAALEAWVAGTRDAQRAEALAHLAMAHARAGRGEAAQRALTEAARLDPALAALRLARERVGPGSASVRPSRPPPSVTAGPGAALAAAAEAALEPEVPIEERAALLRASADQEEPTTTEVLGLDVAAEAGELDEVRGYLERERGRRSGARRLGATLALVDLALYAGDPGRAAALLHEARDEAPGDPLVVWPLVRAEAPEHPRAAAALLLAEAAADAGDRAAFAATWAARLLARAGSDPGLATDRARLAVPAYPPALWVAEAQRRQMGDARGLADTHEALASLHEAAGDVLEAAVRRFRAGLERAPQDPVAATTILEATLDARPDDALLLDFVERLHEATDPARILGWLERAADAVHPALEEGVRLHLASRLEDRAHFARAADVYGALLERHGERALVAVRGLDRVQLALGREDAVVERWNEQARLATTATVRRAALAALAALHARRGDDGSALACWEAVRELSAHDAEALRAIEVAAMEAGREDVLARLAADWLEAPAAPGDVARDLRVALRRIERVDGEPVAAGDAMAVAHGARAALDPWLARRVADAARAHGDDALEALAWRAASSMLATPLERATAALAAVARHPGTAEDLADLLAGPCREAPDHPLAGEVYAEQLEAAGRDEEAAIAFEQAAVAARVPRRVAGLWLRAGTLWQDRVGRPERAVRALDQAARADVAHADVYPRLAALLEARGEGERLAAWTAARIRAGGDPDLLAELHARLADEQQAVGDAQAARASLEAALATQGDREDLLERLARTCLAQGDARRAAEALVRLGATSRRRETLRWVFATLGDLYAGALPDPERARAALERAVELAPRDPETLERLAHVHDRAGRHREAAALWERLVEADIDPSQERAHRLAWAAALRAAGDARAAERVLSALREAHPEDPEVLARLTELVRDRGDPRALADHLDGLAGVLRGAVEAAPVRLEPWVALSDALEEAGRVDAARCVASAAAALGHRHGVLEARLDAHLGAPPLGIRACTPDLDGLLAPRQLDEAVRGALALGEPVLDRIAPFDLRAVGAERLRQPGFVREAEHVAGWFGLPTPELWATDALPRACAAIGPAPALLVGRELLRITDLEERKFLFARALKVAHAGLSLAMRSHPTTLSHLFAALLRLEAPEHPTALPGVAEVDDYSRRLARALPRRGREPLEGRLRAVAARPPVDTTRLGLAASQLGDRAALAAVGSAAVAYGAMLKLAGVLDARDDAARRRRALGAVPEAAALLSFAVSDAYFEARRRAGAEVAR